MAGYMIEMFGVSLLLTIAVELTVAFFFFGKPVDSGMRKLLIILVNVLTNPPAVLACWLAGVWLGEAWRMPVQILVEIVVAAVEAFIYSGFAKDLLRGLRHPVWYAVAANMCSWLTGLLFTAAQAVL